jgi:hypothetical protein
MAKKRTINELRQTKDSVYKHPWMNEQELTESEKVLLDKMNVKAMLIIQIEETLQEIKLPMDKNVLYQMSRKELNGLLEMLNNMEENRKKYAKDETND